MSEAKLKAEARRAKILAREGNRLAVAMGEQASLNPNDTVEAAEPKSKDKRPLAARRNLVKKGAEDASGKDEDAVEPDVASTKEVVSKDKSKSVEEKESKEKKVVITSERTRNIEKEIAKNTANFDEEVLKKAKKEDEEKKKASNAKLIERKAALLNKNPLQAYEVIRVLRLLIIVALAALTGYLSAKTHLGDVLSLSEQRRSLQSTKATTTTATTSGVQAGEEAEIGSASGGGFDARAKLSSFLDLNNDPTGFNPDVSAIADINAPSTTFTIPGLTGSGSIPGSGTRTWVEWLMTRLSNQLECTVSAVLLAWWLSSMLTPLVARFFPAAPKGGNFFSILLSLYNDGMEGVTETVLRTFGEFALHLFVTVATSMAITFFVGSAVSSGDMGSGVQVQSAGSAGVVDEL